MIRGVIISVFILLVLCVGSFWLGTRHVAVVQSTESIVRVDTFYIESPPPALEVKLAEPKVVYLTKYQTDTLTIVRTERDSVLVCVPIAEYTFEQDSLYKINARGYDVTLTSVELYRQNMITTRTLKSPTKHWHLSAGIRSFTCQATTELALHAGVEYRRGRFSYIGAYQFGVGSQGGVALGIQYSIPLF